MLKFPNEADLNAKRYAAALIFSQAQTDPQDGRVPIRSSLLALLLRRPGGRAGEQVHGSAHGGVAPQGAVAEVDDRLLHHGRSRRLLLLSRRRAAATQLPAGGARC